MSTLKDLPLLGVGIGYRPELHREQSRFEDRIDWFELIADRYLRSMPESVERALGMLERHPLVPHGLEMSIGTDEPLDIAYCEEAAELVQTLRAPFYSDHLCMTRAGGLEIGQLTPLPFTEATAARCAEKARRAQEILGVPLLLENITYGFAFPGTMGEADFIRRVVTDGDCGLLLDLANVFINAQNHRYDPIAFLDALPLERVIQIHLAGGELHAGRWVDSHSQSVGAHPEVWGLLDYVVRRAPVRAILIERDQNFPEQFGEMLADIERAREIFSAARSSAPAPRMALPAAAQPAGPAEARLPVDELVFQAALARALVDPERRRRLVPDAGALAAALDLSEAQAGALIAAGVEQIDLFGREVAGKRVMLLAKTGPATYALLERERLLHDAGHRFLDEYIPRQTPEVGSRSLRDGFWFFDLLDRMLADGSLRCPHLADVIAFERVQLRLSSTHAPVEAALAFRAAYDARPRPSVDDILAARPRTGPNHCVLRFSGDVVGVIQRISSGQGLDDVRRELTTILFVKAPGFRNVRSIGITERTRRLLELCDGSRTTAEIAALLYPGGEGPAGDAVQRALRCAEHVRDLCELCALTLTPPAAAS